MLGEVHPAAARPSARRSSAGSTTRRRASAARSIAAPSCSRELIGRARSREHLVDRRRRRLQAARHLRLPLRDDQGAAGRAGSLGRRRGLRDADGPAARARPERRHERHGRGRPRRGVRLRSSRRRADALRRLRGARRPRPASLRRPASARRRGALVKLEESPFYAEGGGQVADSARCAGTGARPASIDVYRVGDDQALRISGPAARAGRPRSRRSVDHETRHATMRNHTATHLLHARSARAARHATCARRGRRSARTSSASTSTTARG